MGRNSGGIREGGHSSGKNYEAEIAAYKNDYDNLQQVKSSIMSYAQVNRWNRNAEYAAGFNDEAQWLIEEIADGNYGLATTIAKQAVGNPNWNKYGYRFSEKQAYVLAKTAIDNELTQKNGQAIHSIWDGNIIKKVREDNLRKKAERDRNYQAYESTYKRSSTKVAVGSDVYSSKYGKGKIVNIITASSGYVSVKYENGTIRKEMAFNLNGADGNPLKKRPKS